MVNGSMIKLSSNESPTISFRIDGQKNRFVYNRPIETIKRKRIDDRWACGRISQSVFPIDQACARVRFSRVEINRENGCISPTLVSLITRLHRIRLG